MPTAVKYAFQNYDRPGYKAATGHDAPPFDPSEPVKTWFDQNDGTSYNIVDLKQPNGMGALELEPGESIQVNIPGTFPWPATPYPGGMPSPADVATLAALVGGTVVPDSSVGIGPPATWADIVVADQKMLAFVAVQQWYALCKLRTDGQWLMQNGTIVFHAWSTVPPADAKYVPTPIVPLTTTRQSIRLVGGAATGNSVAIFDTTDLVNTVPGTPDATTAATLQGILYLLQAQGTTLDKIAAALKV